MATVEAHLSGKILRASQGAENEKVIDMEKVASIVLGGGQGARLFPLTTTRCKPAICFGGRYRLIDVPVSNTLNSGCHKIFIITQFLSTSLHRYISQTYSLDSFSSGFIDVLAVEQKVNDNTWFQGTADAVRQNLEHIVETPVEYFLILSGDQLYNFDFRKLYSYALEKQSDVVVATIAVDEKEAHRMGVMQVNSSYDIIDFVEKPQDEEVLEKIKTSPSQLQKLGVAPQSGRCYLGSMGIYLFRREALFEMLEKGEGHDFGKDLIPEKVKQGSISAYIHDGYWEDIGTIESYYRANLSLVKKEAPFNCYNETTPIYTARYNLPGPKISNTMIRDAIICEGSIIEAKVITNSIIGPRTVIGSGSVIEDSYLMGNDFYESPVRQSERLPEELFIGKGCHIKKAIIDKNVCIGNGVRLINKNQLDHYDGDHIFIRDGIIIVNRGATIPDGFIL